MLLPKPAREPRRPSEAPEATGAGWQRRSLEASAAAAVPGWRSHQPCRRRRCRLPPRRHRGRGRNRPSRTAASPDGIQAAEVTAHLRLRVRARRMRRRLAVPWPWWPRRLQRLPELPVRRPPWRSSSSGVWPRGALRQRLGRPTPRRCCCWPPTHRATWRHCCPGLPPAKAGAPAWEPPPPPRCLRRAPGRQTAASAPPPPRPASRGRRRDGPHRRRR
mmetsp:Transcript_51414/g.166717  ORF Transcript_51414/g.166717 Transcript_51414/m.166717 type:complete len:218 (+) Transcript_51414:370-1023(+)